MQAETRYARSGDVSIAYQVVGDGPLDLILAPDFLSHLEYRWEDPGMARLLARLAVFSRLITFDKRGTGLSDRTAGLDTLEQRMDEVRAGLHTGEIELVRDDVAGIAVHIAARVAAPAGAGEVLASSTVKDLDHPLRHPLRRSRRAPAEGRFRRVAALRGRLGHPPARPAGGRRARRHRPTVDGRRSPGGEQMGISRLERPRGMAMGRVAAIGLVALAVACSPAPAPPTRPPVPTSTLAPPPAVAATSTVATALSPRPSPTRPVAPSASPTAAPGAPSSPRGAGSAEPRGDDCPPDYPFKAARRAPDDWRYFAPGDAGYGAAVPDDCFATAADAEVAGYRSLPR